MKGARYENVRNFVLYQHPWRLIYITSSEKTSRETHDARAPFERIWRPLSLSRKAGCLRDICGWKGFSKSTESPHRVSAKDSIQPSRRSLKRISRGSRTVPAHGPVGRTQSRFEISRETRCTRKFPWGRRWSYTAAVLDFQLHSFEIEDSPTPIPSGRTHEHVRDPVSLADHSK